MQAKLNLGISGERRNVPPAQRINSFEQLENMLDSKELQSNLKDMILNELKYVPEGALDFYWNNIDQIIVRSQQKLGIHAPPPVRPEVQQEHTNHPNIIRPQEVQPVPTQPKPKQTFASNPSREANLKFIQEIQEKGGNIIDD